MFKNRDLIDRSRSSLAQTIEENEDKIRERVLVFTYSLETRLKKGRHNASTFLRCHVRVITRQFQFLFYFAWWIFQKVKGSSCTFSRWVLIPLEQSNALRTRKIFEFTPTKKKKEEKEEGETETGIKKKKKDSLVYSTNKSSRKLSSARSKISIIMEVSFRVKIFCQPKASVKKRRIRNDESSQIRIESLIDITRKRKKKKTRRKSISFNKLTTKGWYERKDIALSING